MSFLIRMMILDGELVLMNIIKNMFEIFLEQLLKVLMFSLNIRKITENSYILRLNFLKCI